MDMDIALKFKDRILKFPFDYKTAELRISNKDKKLLDGKVDLDGIWTRLTY
jgi:hypothetical protein